MIFDADGTLFDYDRAELEALSSTFRDYGLSFDDGVHSLFTEINGRLWKELELGTISSQELRVRRFRELADALSLPYSAPAFSADYLRCLGAQRHLITGAEGLVKKLALGCRLALATNGIAEVQRSRLSASTIEPFFQVLVISEEIGHAKPDPGYFQELFRQIGNPQRSNVLMVGDGLSSDIKGGMDFGIDTCWFNPCHQENATAISPTYEVSALAEVLEIAGRA